MFYNPQNETDRFVFISYHFTPEKDLRQLVEICEIEMNSPQSAFELKE